MSLKFRYAFFLLLMVGLLAIFAVSTVYFILNGSYLLTVCLLIMLYLITYQLGRKFSTIFLTLSFLRLLKKQDGIISLEKYQAFINRALAGRRSNEEKEQLSKEILEILVDEGIVKVQDSTIVLVSP
jgi:hypothetical protein